MKRSMQLFAAAFLATCLFAGTALATPSTQIWIPSTDIQKFKTLHLGIDNYVVAEGDGAAVYDFGLTAGVLPFEKVQMEVGADYIVNGSTLDEYPYYLNAKLATPEDALFKGAPALAVGGYGFGLKKDLTDQNILYGLAAKTLPVVGRFSFGYFVANDEVVTTDSEGYLASWDRTLSEISPKLWAAIDYQGGKSALGALSFGLSWAFADNVSVIFGYDIFNDDNLNDTFNTQLDINF